jgi:hypothetical protein
MQSFARRETRLGKRHPKNAKTFSCPTYRTMDPKDFTFLSVSEDVKLNLLSKTSATFRAVSPPKPSSFFIIISYLLSLLTSSLKWTFPLLQLLREDGGPSQTSPIYHSHHSALASQSTTTAMKSPTLPMTSPSPHIFRENQPLQHQVFSPADQSLGQKRSQNMHMTLTSYPVAQLQGPSRKPRVPVLSHPDTTIKVPRLHCSACTCHDLSPRATMNGFIERAWSLLERHGNRRDRVG